MVKVGAKGAPSLAGRPLRRKRPRRVIFVIRPLRSALRYGERFHALRSVTKGTAFGYRKPFEKGLTQNFYN